MFYNVGDYIYEQQTTLLQPVGGMDAIPKALAKKLGSKIVYNAPVSELRKTDNGVQGGVSAGWQTSGVNR